MVKFGKIEWLVSAGCSLFTLKTVYDLGQNVYVNVPYFSEIASSTDVDMKRWMYTTGGEVIVFGIM